MPEQTNGAVASELPEQLRRQIAEADAIRADLSRDPNAPTPPETELGAAPPSQSVAAPPQPETLPPGGPPVEDDQSWEQRYRSLHGRFENTQRSNQQMADRLGHLENLIAGMQARGVEPERPAAAVPLTKPKLVTDDEVRDYGSELLDVVGRRAKEEYAPEFQELAARVDRLQSRVEGVGTVIEGNQKKTVYEGLQEHIPDWKAINNADEFKAWLALPDTYSGRRRYDMLREAFDRHETGRVVAFFRGFLTEATGSPPTSPSPGPSAPPLANGNGSGRPSLEDFAAPGRARSAPQQLPPDKPVYTSASIAKFADDRRTGKYRGREADAEAIERDIYQAQHEGRIQP